MIGQASRHVRQVGNALAAKYGSHGVVVVATGCGVAAYTKHRDVVLSMVPGATEAQKSFVDIAQHVPLQANQAVASTDRALLEQAPLGADCSLHAVEVGIGAPVWHLPTGVVCCPVLVPIWGPVVANGWNAASTAEHFYHAGSTVNLANQDPTPATGKRTGASRPQRRRRRHQQGGEVQPQSAWPPRHCEILSPSAWAVPGRISTTDSSPRTRTPPQLHELIDEQNGFPWPATPESTPPTSPRSSPMAVAMAASGELTESEAELMIEELGAAGVARRTSLLAQLAEDAWPLATSPTGCRVLQRAVEVASPAEQAALAEGLRGHVVEAAASPQANFVLQKCITVMPPARLSFVLEEMRGHAVAAAKSRSGCRVLERIVEHFSTEQAEELVGEVLSGAESLCRHAFGNFVIQHILEHGTPAHQSRVAAVLGADAQRLARHRVASHVIKCALVNCTAEDKRRLVEALSADAEALADLAHHHCGSFVMRELKRAGGPLPSHLPSHAAQWPNCA